MKVMMSATAIYFPQILTSGHRSIFTSPGTARQPPHRTFNGPKRIGYDKVDQRK